MIAGSIHRSYNPEKKDDSTKRLYENILRMSGNSDNKKQLLRAISNHVSILGVPDTPPSGDSSKYRFL
jgi:hypothetical protein